MRHRALAAGARSLARACLQGAADPRIDPASAPAHRRGARAYTAKAESFGFCQDLVQRSDVESFLCLPFVPANARPSVLAVRAFNVEVAKAADKASDVRIAEMRLKWWDGVVDNLIKRNPPEHPIADALCDALHSHDLDPDLLRSVIEWRVKDLHIKQPETVADLEKYAEGTQAALQSLCLSVLGVGKHEGSMVATRHVGIAMGLALVLRGTRFHASRNKLYIPKEVASAYKLSPGSVAKGQPTQELSQCVYDLSMLAKDHLDKAKAASWSADALPALYPAAIPRIFLDKLEELEFDIMHPDWNNQGTHLRVRLPLTLMKNRMLGTF